MIKTIIKSVAIAEAISCVFFVGMGAAYGSIAVLEPETGEKFRDKLTAEMKTGPLDKRIVAASTLVGEKIGRYLTKDSIEA